MNQEERANRLWDYIDGLCTEEEAHATEQLMADDPEWKQEYESLMQLQSALQDLEPVQPSMRFSKNIMEEIARLSPPAHRIMPPMPRLIRLITSMAASLLLILVAIGSTMLSWQPKGRAHEVMTNLRLGETGVPILIVVNILFALLFVDKLFNKRRNAGHV